MIHPTTHSHLNLPATSLFIDIKKGIVRRGSLRVYLIGKIRDMLKSDKQRPDRSPMRLGMQY